MYAPEVHETVREVTLLERLNFELQITDEQYRSTHDTSGELRVFTKATDDVVLDREHPPKHPLHSITDTILGGGNVHSSFPGTKLYVGMAREPPLEQDDDAFQDDYLHEAVSIDGLPENGVIEFDLDWNVGEAKESRSGDVERMDTTSYDVEGFPSDQLPIIVRANLHRDARRVADTIRSSDTRGKQHLEGRAALIIELEHRDNAGGASKPLYVDGFRIDMTRTFPQIQFEPETGASYDPESRRVEWTNDRVAPDGKTTYAVIGPIEELLAMDRVTASLRGELRGRTLSGMKVTDLFDESGARVRDSLESGRRPDVGEKVTITADVEIDPSALRGEAKEVSNATVTVDMTPYDAFEQIVRVCDRTGIHIIDREAPGEGEPMPGRDGVFHVNDDPGELDVRRQYGDEGVVYAGIEVTGRFVAETEETQVSAFDESEDRLVRRTEGGLGERGRSTLEVRARSTSSELNSRFLSSIEEAFGGVRS